MDLTQTDKASYMNIVLETVRRNSRHRTSQWRDTANLSRKKQKVAVGQLVWAKRDYTTSLGKRKLGMKWIGPFKVKEELANGNSYRVENVFDGTVIQITIDK